MKRLRRWFLVLRGKWRMWWGLCPWCNSDAPALYCCPVCCYWERGRPDGAYRDAAGHWSYGPSLWAVRYAAQICNHEWTGKKLYVPGEPDDYVEFCRHCGTENPGSWVE